MAPDSSVILSRLRAGAQGLSWRRFTWGVSSAVLLLWASSGLMLVDTGEVAVVDRLGAIVRTVGSGIHMRLPRPFESDLRVRLMEVRRVESPSRRILTGDHNLVELGLVVQYSVLDPVAFTTVTVEPESVVSGQVAAASTSVAAGMSVDDLLTTRRGELQRLVMEQAQASLDRFGAGIRLVSVEIQTLSPPEPVVDAFNDVSSARGDRETIALSAEAYSSRLLPDVRGKAATQTEQARASAAETLARARGESARFASLDVAWRQDPKATREELRAEALRRIAPNVEILTAPPGVEIAIPSSAGR